ncbi:hypothetical protein SAMN04488057_10687 [Cyclobacterium lianum]|uniref:Uncharacterized protein n=1 Tax=Cyclobacterium lianum TaxID=388280 RepID=A0A1M7NUP7_9BACT|nr:hypothetical protein SAMN04488057_10687 [Cyclobacterium lianum]
MWSPFYLAKEMEARLGSGKILFQTLSIISAETPGQTGMKIRPLAVSN